MNTTGGASSSLGSYIDTVPLTTNICWLFYA